jgi:hypothetical protein
MIDPVTGNVLPNGMQDVRALGMTASNPFLASQMQPKPVAPPVMPARPQDMLSPVPMGAQSLGAPAVPGSMPGLPGDMMAAAGAQMPVTGAAAPSPFGGRIPQGLLGALLRLSQRNPERFDARMQSPMAQRFGITPEMVQGFQPPAQGMGMGNKGGFGPQVMPQRPMGMGQGFAPPAQGGGFDPAQAAAQSQLGMDRGSAKNQNIGSTPAY